MTERPPIGAGIVSSMHRIAIALALVFASGCPHTRDRGACSKASHCKPGYACAPWGRCSDQCTTNAQCLGGEQCVPSSEQAGEDGVRWCAVPCDPNDPNACESKLDHFGSRTECREITYPHTSYGGASSVRPGPLVTGFFCSDPHNGWGGTGNDPEAADESGG